MTVCPNCTELHTGMFDLCYQCFDCESEEELNERKKHSDEWDNAHKLTKEKILNM